MPVSITVTGITQDEPVNGSGDGNSCPDATGIGTDTARLRAERSAKGDGRVYHVSFVASDGEGDQCSGTVAVCVPRDVPSGCIDEGPLVDSTVSVCPVPCEEPCAVEVALGSLCTGERVPPIVSKRVARAQTLLARAARAVSERRAKRLVAAAMRNLKKAARIASHAKQKGVMSLGCSQAFGQILTDAEGRVQHWLVTPR